MAVKKKGRLGGGGGGKKPAPQDLKLPYTPSQIWTAGVGAVSRAQEGGSKLFEDLVREGSRLHGGALDAAQKVVMQAFQGAQKSVNRRVDDVRDQATETWDNLETLFQGRVHSALQQLGVPTAEEIRLLTKRVAELNESVQALSARQARGRAAKGRRRTTKGRARKAPARARGKTRR